jgi:alpha-D-ribose 1-methylphosphonate 5-triphosphate synthase subunit PhnI
MGYTTVANREAAVLAAAELLASGAPADGDDELSRFVERYPLAVDQVMAEAGIVEPRVCARAFAQAQGDLARAVSLVRAWSAMLPRLAHRRTSPQDWLPLRRITPAFAEPSGGQFLGASRDYERRLLDFDDRSAARAGLASPRDGAAAAPSSAANPADGAQLPAGLPAANETLAAEGLVAECERARPDDITRATPSKTERGPFLQSLARAETGALTALAYGGIRGYGGRRDPTLVELRAGEILVRFERPDTGQPFVVGSFVATYAEVALYAVHESGETDAAFTLGTGVTPGRVERRAIASALLDAAAARAALEPDGARAPYDDREFITLTVDGQEASGFVEHLKLPHHVTFAAELERVRALRPSPFDRLRVTRG